MRLLGRASTCRPRTTSLLGPSCLLRLPLQLHSLPGTAGQQLRLTEVPTSESDRGSKHRFSQKLSDIATATGSSAGRQSWLRELCAARAARKLELDYHSEPCLDLWLPPPAMVSHFAWLGS